MPSKKVSSTKPKKPAATDARVKAVLAELERHASKQTRDGMARYAIPSEKALGVSVAALRELAKQIGSDHVLASALWQTDVYEARMLAAFLDEPARVTPAQMERWCKDFDNWAICDTVCFHLFDRTPHAFDKVAAWAGRPGEFEKRAAFALLASLAGHDKLASEAAFTRCLPLIARGAQDPRNFVKKAVSWALRRIGTRSPQLHKATLELAQKLAASDDPSTRWVGKDALRDLTRAKEARAPDVRSQSRRVGLKAH